MHFTVSSDRIEASADRVWEVATDINGAPHVIEGIDRIEPLAEGPVGQGYRWRETRTMMGRKATEEMEITAWNPPHSYTVEADTCGAHFVTLVRVDRDGEGARITYDVTAKPLSLGAKLMAPLGALFSGAAKKAMARDLEGIKRACEQENAT